MPRALKGQMKFEGGEWRVRLSVYVGPNKRERRWYALGTADKALADRRRERLLADLRLAEKNAAACAGKTVEKAPEPPRALRFGAYARAWHAARKDEGIAFAESEIILLEKYILGADVGTERTPCRFEDLILGDIRPRHVKAVLLGAKALGKSKQTVQHVRGTLGRVLRQAVEDELIPENVVKKVKSPRMVEVTKKRVILTDDEVLVFWACEEVDLEIRLLSLVARCEGGMRTRDCTAWDWTMIDRVRFAACVIPRTKTNAPQEVPIPEILQAPLQTWWVKAGCPESGPVFPIVKGKRKGETRRTRGVSFAKRLRRGLLRAGVTRLPPIQVPARRMGTRTDLGRRAAGTMLAPNPADPLFFETATTLPVDFHGYRRAFKTALAEANVSNERAMMLSGSSDPRAHARYIMATPEMMRIPAAAIPHLRKGIERAPGLTGASCLEKSSMNPERDTRFELATLSLGSRCAPKNAEDLHGSPPTSPGPDPLGISGGDRERAGKGTEVSPATVEALRVQGRAIAVEAFQWDCMDAVLAGEGES